VRDVDLRRRSAEKQKNSQENITLHGTSQKGNGDSNQNEVEPGETGTSAKKTGEAVGTKLEQ